MLESVRSVCECVCVNILWYIKLTYVSFRAHVKLVSRICIYSSHVAETLVKFH